MTSTILAPYGALKHLPLSAKVGGNGKEELPAVLAPYGSMDYLPITSKVGDNGKGDNGDLPV